MWAFLMQNGGLGARGALVKLTGVPSGDNSTLVYFICDDCAVEEGRVNSSGRKIHRLSCRLAKTALHRSQREDIDFDTGAEQGVCRRISHVDSRSSRQ